MLCHLQIAHSPVFDQRNGTLSLTTSRMLTLFTPSRNSSNVFYSNKCININFIQMSWEHVINFGWFWRYINSLWLIDWTLIGPLGGKKSTPQSQKLLKMINSYCNSVPNYSVLPIHYKCQCPRPCTYFFPRTNVENDLHMFVLERKNTRYVLCVQNLWTRVWEQDASANQHSPDTLQQKCQLTVSRQ